MSLRCRRRARGSLAGALALTLAWPGIAGATAPAPAPTTEADAQPTKGSGDAGPGAPAGGPAASGDDAPARRPAAPDDTPDPAGDAVDEGRDAADERGALDPAAQSRRDQAAQHYREGQRLYGNGFYVEAAAEFERSFTATPAANTLYAASLAYSRAGKTVEAVRSLERYLAMPDCSQWPPEEQPLDCTTQRAEAEQALAEQRRRVGELTLRIPEGVALREVRVAGRPVPLDEFPLLMLPGTVDVELFGMGPGDRRMRPAYITAGETYEVYVAPFEVDVVPIPTVVETDPEPSDRLRTHLRVRRLRVTFWTGVGLTAASGAALGVLGGLSRYHERRYHAEKCEPGCFVKDENGAWVLDENGDPIPRNTGFPLIHREKFERYKPISNALAGVTVGLAVGTALVGAFAFRPRAREARERERAHVRVGASGLVVRW